MPATVTSVRFMYNDWADEVEHTLDVIGLPVEGERLSDLNVMATVAGSSPPPSLRVSLNSYEPASRLKGRGSYITYPELELLPFSPKGLPPSTTAYRGSVKNLENYMVDADGWKEVATVARGGGTSDIFFRKPLLAKGWLSRGVGHQPKVGTLDPGNEARQEPASELLFKCGGVEVIEAAVQPQPGLTVGPKAREWAFVRSAADVFYYSGHGAFWNGGLILPNHDNWLTPEALLDYWRRQPKTGKGPMDLDVFFIAGCSVLYIDFDNPGNPYSHGRRWAELLNNRQGPLVALLGYGAGKEAPPSPRGGKAPADSDGKGHQTGNLIAQRMAEAMAGGLAYKDYAAKWVEINRKAGIYTAIGIDVWEGYRDALNPDKPRKL